MNTTRPPDGPALSSREQALLRAALELTPLATRAAFLEQACAGDLNLRRRLEALLAARAQPGEQPSGSNDSKDASLRLEMADLAPAEGVGQTIGRYKFLEQLGQGGCGIVYVAEQTEPVRRRVALKIIKLGMDTREVIARFEAERQALAMMDHPNIARVLDAGATETGRPYFVMELVRGLRITDYCDRNRLNTRQRIELFIKVCQAIQHAHQKGIIHRDVKPSNILVTLNDGVPVPKVIDFGIAKAIEGRLTTATVYTQFHHFVGTPVYMSPEQAEMSGLDIDTRSDIYSLGVMLYELLTGKTPFDGAELLSMGVDDMRRTIRERDPASPSLKLETLDAAQLTKTAEGRSIDAPRLIHLLRGDLDWIIMKCLEKDRTRRYATANALAADLARHLNNEPVVARPPSATYRLQKAFRRHQVVFLTAGAVVLALVLGLTASIWQAARATRAEALASRRLAESEAISSFLTDVFQSPDPARDGRSVTVAETLDTAQQRLSSLSNQPVRLAQLQTTLGRTYVALGLPNDAIPLLKQAQAAYKARLGREHRDTLAASRLLAVAYSAAQHMEEGIQLQRELLEHYRRLGASESPESIRVMTDLANSYAAAKRNEAALELRRQILPLSQKVNGREHPETIRAMLGLALSLPDNQGVGLLEQAYPLSRKVNGLENPATVNVGLALEFCYSRLGRREDLLKLLESLVPMTFKVYGPDHRFTRRALAELERAYYDAGRWQDALELKADYARWNPKDLNAELLIVQAWFGREADYKASCHRLLKFAQGTQVLSTAERAAKACLLLPTTDPTVLEPAHALARRAVDLGAEDPFFGWYNLALGMAEYRLGNYHAADKALQAADQTAPINAGFFRAMSLYRQGQAAEARRLFRAAADQMKPLPDDEQNPLANGASGDDLIRWLAYREAAMTLGLEPSGPMPVNVWVATLQQELAKNPADTIRSLHLALVYLWLGQSAQHEALCRRLLDACASSSESAANDRAAKAYLLCANPDPATLKLACAAARRALASASPGDANLPWFRTVAGMAAFRDGNLPEAEELLEQAIQQPLQENQRRLALAFHIMTRWRAGRRAEARSEFDELAKLDLSLPDRARMSPLVRDQDQLAVRLACAEATALFTPQTGQ